MWLAVVLASWLAWPGGAVAAGCSGLDPLHATDLASRISSVACRESRLWYEAFIDVDGRLANIGVAEMETGHLSDGVTPAWKRVVDYWRGSGLLGAVAQRPGASTCEYVTNDSYASPNCRGFLIDTPWSAAFVSWVMVQSGVPGFTASPSHIDYVRAAYRSPDASPYTLADPLLVPPGKGDMLCYVRSNSGLDGFRGMMAWLGANPSGMLPMHCDIVVDANGSGDGRAYLVGGNVLHTVAQRILPVNRTGQFWNLPQSRSDGCRPSNPKACNFNFQNWVVLLKLKPRLPMRAMPQISPQPPQPRQECCVYCVVGSDIPRCPVGTTPPGP